MRPCAASRFLYPAAVTALIRDYLDRARAGGEPLHDPLTPRELEILKLTRIAGGDGDPHLRRWQGHGSKAPRPADDLTPVAWRAPAASRRAMLGAAGRRPER